MWGAEMIKLYNSDILPIQDTSDDVFVFPGFCDVHVHFREPGFCYKETIATGSRAAARGGYTACLTMPNLNPVPDNTKALSLQLEAIRKDAVIGVYPYGAITVCEQGAALSDMEALAQCGAIAFSDDGKGVQSPELMRSAMRTARRLGKIIAAHCEDNAYAAPESEWREIERDISLARETGCAFHVCHVSCKKSVELIRQAKHEGIDITCETAPHYLLLSKDTLRPEGNFKMNPPIGTEEDRQTLLDGLLDGTIDMIATDHAPHSAEEKSRGFQGSLSGIVGIETAFPLLYTYLVRPGILSLEKLLALMSDNPRKRFGLPAADGYTVWNLAEKYTIDPTEFLSKGKSTPFENVSVYGRCLLTVHQNTVAYRR